MCKCDRCGKEIPYEQTAVDFQFYQTENDMTEDEKQCYVFRLSRDLDHLRFVKNFVVPSLCYDCCKELGNVLEDFIKEKK